MIYLPTLEVVRAAAHKAIDEHAPGSLSTASTAALSSGIGGAVASVASSAVRPNSPSFPPPPPRLNDSRPISLYTPPSTIVP